MTSSGDIYKADGRSDTSFQSLAQHVDTGELLIHKYETGNGGTTHVRNSKQDLKQDLLSSSFLSRHDMIPVQDHDNPRVVQRCRPRFEITCYEVNRLWFMPLCVWGKGCDNCQKCQAVKSLTCWDENGKLMEFVHTDNVRFGTLPVPETKVAALHTAKVKIQAADERRTERRATTSDGSSSHLGRQLILLEFGDFMQVLEDNRSPSSRPSFEEGNMSNLACSNQSSTQHVVSHVMALKGAGEQVSPPSQGRADSSDMHTDTAEQERRVQEQAKLGIIARVFTPPRVPVRGGPCKDEAASKEVGIYTDNVELQEDQAFAENTGPPPAEDEAASNEVGIYTDNVELQEDQASTVANGKTRVLMTKEEPQAFKLRELYCDPKTFPHESLILEGDLLVEYMSPQLSSQVPSSRVESRGYDDWDQLFPDESASNEVDIHKGNAELQEDQLEVGEKTSPTPAMDEAESNQVDTENAELEEDQASAENTGPPPNKDEAASKRVGIYTDNVELQEDQASLFESDNDTEDEDLEDRVAATDEEYQELVEVQQRKLLPKLTDSEVRQAAEDNVKSTVIRDDEVEDEDGVSVQEFLRITDSTLPRSNSDESSQDLEYQKMRRRAKSRKMSDLSNQDKTSLKELLNLIPEGPHKITNREKDALRTAYLNNLNITWLVDENPKKRNSKAKFALYWKEGRNDIVAAKANGMTWADYLNDFEKGYFRIDTVVLDQNPELAAVLMDPVTTESIDSLSKPSLVSALLDAPVYAPGTRVILKNMDQSRYRNAEYNNISGRVRSYCEKTKRTLVDVTGLGVVWLRNINLIEDEGLRQHVPSRTPNPHPKLVALLELKQRTQDLLDRSMVVKEISDRIKMLEMELADPEPLSVLALYEMMAEAYKTSIQKAYEVYCPKDLRSATTCKDRLEWIKSIRKEVNDLAAMKTWTVVPRSMAKQEGKNVMKSGLVFRVKADNDGFVTSFKSRFVCKGYSEVYGQDYFNVRSGVVDYSSARMLIALAAAERAELWTYDVKSAFVSTDVPKGEEFYCEAPQDIYNNELFGDMFVLPDGTRGILKCSKCLYGSKNSPRRFWQKLQNTLQKGGFSTTVQDQCVLICDRTKYGGGILKVAMWVDDLLVTTTSKADKEWFDGLMRDSFDLSEDSGVEPARLYLGMKVTRDYEKQTITLSTPALIEAMVKDLEEKGHISAKTIAKQHPMSGTRLEELQDKAEALDEKSYPYRSVVGICLHLSRTTRPDIALAVSELSKYVTCYGQQHVKAANWLALYLKGTADLGITYHGNLPDHLRNKMITFSDADWAGDTQARKSRSGYTIQLNLGPIEWYTKGQTITATSSCMSETIAAVEAAKAIVSTRLLMFELGYRQPGSSRLYVDNEATVLNANGTNQSKRSKHFQIRTELLRVFTDLGRLHVFKVDTNLNISDLHTKPLLGTKFTEMRDIMMGIVPDLNMLHYS